MLGFKTEVVDLGPAWPYRIGFDPDDAPIAEAMPGDRVRLSPMIFAADGRALPAADFDALWIQCGQGCGPDVPPCDDVEWTTQSSCVIGRGGEIEFEVPPLEEADVELDFEFDPFVDGILGMRVIAIVALDPGIDAERCLQLTVTPTPDLQRCGVVNGGVQIGPRWGLLVERDEAGYEVSLPIWEIPLLALYQPANRLPLPTMPTWFDAQTDEPITGEPLRVRAGQTLRGEGPVWRAADAQPYVFRISRESGDVFIGGIETLNAEWFVSAGLRVLEMDPEFVEIVVEEDARPGRASAVMRFSSDRSADPNSPALDVRVVEFEVVP